MTGSPSKCSWRIMCTWHLSPVYNRSRFLDERSTHLRCCFLFCSDLETSVKPEGRDDHTDISLRIHLLISWQMKCFVLRSLIHLFKVWMCSINSRLTSGFFLPLGPKRFFWWVLYIFKKRNEFYRAVESHPQKQGKAILQVTTLDPHTVSSNGLAGIKPV